MPEADGFPDSLPATLDRVLALLEEGTARRKGAAHAPTLATVGLDGRPRLRTVVLRGLDRGTRSLRFHTDRRSEKVPEIEREPRVALHVYDAAAKFQVRLEGRATLHAADAVADEAWAGTRPMSRVCYGTLPAPGTVIPDGGAFALPAEDGSDGGRENFVAIVMAIDRVETLYLAYGGHRRATFRFGPDEATWLVP